LEIIVILPFFPFLQKLQASANLNETATVNLMFNTSASINDFGGGSYVGYTFYFAFVVAALIEGIYILIS
jgi:hypothetical protein